MSSSLPIRRLLISLKARYHLWCGKRAYRSGDIADAGVHGRKVIQGNFESYDAYLLLGKIHYRLEDYRVAAEYFRRAQHVDQGRFLLEGFPDDFIASLHAERPAGGRPEYNIVIRSTAMREPKARARAQPVEAPLGDFSSRDEWLEHRDRPTLRAGEWADVDWDAEARKFFEQ